MATKIAVMTDIHANLPALQAALSAMKLDRVVGMYYLPEAWITTGDEPLL
jgi:hypothetical protein